MIKFINIIYYSGKEVAVEIEIENIEKRTDNMKNYITKKKNF